MELSAPRRGVELVASYVLVHGAWHGAWCWQRVAGLLREQGHEVCPVDLPAHGADSTPAYRVTLGSYSQCVQRAAAELSSPPILVGHSMGGMIISQAAADAPGLCAALVYVCGIIPVEGETIRGLVSMDKGSHLRSSVCFSTKGYHVRPTHAQSLFYGECSSADATAAAANLCSDPLVPLIQRYAERHPLLVPKGYIECTLDRTISVEHQRAMASRSRFQMRASIVADHSPFLSAPGELAEHLHAMAALDHSVLSAAAPPDAERRRVVLSQR